MADDGDVNLKNSASLTSSSSTDSSDQDYYPRISGFMKNVAPPVVTKYINTNKMDSPFDNRHIHGYLYGGSIFQTALAIKTGNLEMSRTESFDSNARNKMAVKTTKIETSSTESIRSKGDRTQRNGAKLLTNSLISTRTASRAIRRHERSAAKRSKRTSSSDAVAKDTKKKSPFEMLTPLQRRVLKVKKYAREHKASVPKPSCPSHAAREATEKVSKRTAIEQHVQGKMTHNIKTCASNSSNQSVKAVPLLRDRPKQVYKTVTTNEAKEKIPDSHTSNHPGKLGSSVQQTTVNKSHSEDISSKASAHVSNNTIEHSVKKSHSREPTNYAPFDEADENHQEKVEVVVIPGNTNTHQTIIIDSSRDLNHTVSFDTEDQEASLRRMELVRRARSLIKSRTDPTPCSNDAVQVNLM
jgi:hypothetical protein